MFGHNTGSFFFIRSEEEAAKNGYKMPVDIADTGSYINTVSFNYVRKRE